ncbi:hypothetical protein [Paraburkholderia caledonica]|uniref:DUF4148 domain-containing protein n=1 Tax=Paraburkholderia caledonica TaxID=134536 RepID=A0AB73INE6_9BURK|nr:hypothetical protein [Paraburkholderia caledonica]
MLFRNLAAALLCAALSIALPANAGMPPMSDDQLAASAELIVRGCVESVVKHD